ncbi:outer membrane lipoprotein carrier protein LolA [Plantactinospora solaniradicis]|uniref:Outer membrane lipoprotein carrier protein LolA n=1 Tax=Plantactinospora solaniradicis TaxID=1723736 RepID=A0ABW1KGF6_9ACTN
MSVFHTRPALRWLVPTGTALAIIGGGAAVGTFASAAEPSLPERSAAQLLVDLQTARLDGLSGTVIKRADLGLPSLPGIGGRGSAELTSLISGTHTLRVWHAGPDKTRVALLGTLGETDVIRNGADIWVWDSQKNEARHSTLDLGDGAVPKGRPDHLPSSPQEAAEQALAAIDPSTEVSVGRSATIAGRDAYELVLEPRDETSLVGQIKIAIDAGEHVPLRFQIVPEGTRTPAFEIAFTQVDFERPDPAQFAFNPPPGTKVTEEPLTADKPAATPAELDKPTFVGTGWTTVLIAQVPQLATAANADTDGGQGDLVQGILGGLPKVSGEWGSGRLLKGKLFTALATDDGRVLVGAVTPERLYEVAQGNR